MEKIPLSSPDIGPKEIELINQVLKTPYVSIGPMVPRFEEAVAHYVGVKHAVAVNSGTSGLHLAVIAAGIREGDEVITTPFSFVASANCILYERGIPVFVDVHPESLNIDVEKIEEKITPRTRAILPVHVFGQPCAMDKIMEVAGRHGLMVIEDACEAIGAKLNDRQVGTFGECGVFAFYANKQITTGEGGVLVTDRDDWDWLFRSLRNQGRDDHGAWLRHVYLGYNYRFGELNAALGVIQMERIEELLGKRAQVAEWYNERLADLELIERPYISPITTRMSWFVYVVRIKPPANRNEVMHRLAEAGIPSRPYFTPIHLQPFYQERFGYKPGDFPVSEYMGEVSLALPFSSVMKEDQVEYVCNALKKILRK
jgi:dTDP-4-amino-4,6-dideoxygalactose transaminase